jgi:uncharacterized protein
MEETRAAMERGEPVIYQALLEDGDFSGYADFLIRVPGRSRLGDYLYEVWDTKLARKAKPYHALQICCYADMLEPIQGAQAVRGGIVLGDGAEEPLLLDDFRFHYRAVRKAFLEMQRTFDQTMPMQIPIRGEFGHWTGHVEAIREKGDDLTLVAGIRESQIRRLRAAGVLTLTGLAQSDLPSVQGIAQRTYERLRCQAEYQRLSIGEERPLFRIVAKDPDQPRLGLAALPPTSPGDVFFDMEGYPLADKGLEYLFGASFREHGERRYVDWWAHTRNEEKSAFESFIAWVYARWQNDSAMHIYHYADYERAAMQRLSRRHATCEREVDELLRNEVFVDLYQVVRQGLVIGNRSYSLKHVERLYRPQRQTEVATAGASIVQYARWLDDKDGESVATSGKLQAIRDYNRDDCDSTLELADWLWKHQKREGIAYEPPPPGDGPSEELNERAAFAQRMIERGSEIEDAELKRIYLLLAHLIEFHRREDAPMWWRYFDRLKKSEEQLMEDADCLAGLTLEGKPERVKQSFRYTYRFPEQETKIREGQTCRVVANPDIQFDIETMDFENGRLTFRRGIRSSVPPLRLSLLPFDYVPCRDVQEALLTLASNFDSKRYMPKALADFLARREPDLGTASLVDLGHTAANQTCLAVDAACAMGNTALVIQGPPGCGKTYTGARMIRKLIRKGMRVGVMSNSHRAIGLLLREAVEACQAADIPCDAANVDKDEDAEIPGVTRLNTGTDLEDLPSLPSLVGGTAWVFARPGLADCFDYLFIDEAGQVSLANLAAVSRCARNLVIIGDQRQLNQPMQGAHPEGSGVSILEYYLGDEPAVSPEKGILLDTTFRMRPELCRFISESVYAGKLTHAAVTLGRQLIPGSGQDGWAQRSSGLLFTPVRHESNSYESHEEADMAERLCREMLEMRYQDESGSVRTLRAEDILVVSPYNLQVLLLQRRLPKGVRIGTVDKFQGQEGPVVIYSMATSSGEDCARGIDFLFSPNRFNVALSRAKVLAILLASDRLARTNCHSLEQMRLVNLFCRGAEAGTVERPAVGVGEGPV